MSVTSERAPGPGRPPAELIVVFTPPMQKGAARVAWFGAPDSPPDAGVPFITMFRPRAIPRPPRAVGVLGCPSPGGAGGDGQNTPLTSLARLLPVAVLSGRAIPSGPAHWPTLGRQSMLVCVVGLPTVHARPARAPALQRP